jgi:hypothetical protein
MEYEEGVPRPVRRVPKPRPFKYGFDGMKVNQSVTVSYGDEEPLVVYRRVAASAYGYARRSGKGFTVAKITGGVRVWRDK